MVCQYGMILYETIDNPDNQHAFQAFKISDVSEKDTKIENGSNVQTNK